MNNDALAETAAIEVLRALETTIQGQPTVKIYEYDHAKRIVKAAMLGAFYHTTNERMQPHHVEDQ